MKRQMIRFTCDAPNCKDVVDVDETTANQGFPIVGHEVSPQLPDGWIEFQLAGGTVDGMPEMVHASKPECATALVEDQVEQAIAAAATREEEAKANRKLSEEAQKDAVKAMKQQDAERELALQKAAEEEDEPEVAEER